VSVVYRCDGCDGLIEQEADRFDVNVFAAIDDVDDSDPDDIDLSFTATTLVSLDGNAQYHFCDPSCLGAWAMNRALDNHD
jgi:hypothetical protein